MADQAPGKILSGGTTPPMFSREMTIWEILSRHPLAEAVLAGFHLTGCATCTISRDETLEEVCMIYGLPLPEVLSALNALGDKSTPVP